MGYYSYMHELSLPCPFCDSEKAKMWGNKNSLYGEDLYLGEKGYISFSVYCHECEAQGCAKDTQAEAIDSWRGALGISSGDITWQAALNVINEARDRYDLVLLAGMEKKMDAVMVTFLSPKQGMYTTLNLSVKLFHDDDVYKDYIHEACDKIVRNLAIWRDKRD